MATPDTVRIGFVRRAVGLRGELEVELLTDQPDRFRPGIEVRAGSARRSVVSARPSGAGVRLRLEGIEDRTGADRLRGSYLEVDAAEAVPLPEGHYYHWQLLGLKVEDLGGRQLGEITDILEYPANDVYVVGDDPELLVPALAAVVREVDLSCRRMVVDLPPEDVVR